MFCLCTNKSTCRYGAHYLVVAHQDQRQSHLSLNINYQLPYFFLDIDKPTFEWYN